MYYSCKHPCTPVLCVDDEPFTCGHPCTSRPNPYSEVISYDNLAKVYGLKVNGGAFRQMSCLMI